VIRRLTPYLLIAALLALVLALLVDATGEAATPRPDPPTTSAALYDSRCGDAYRGVRWLRARYNEHRATMGLTPAPPIEQAMGCRRLRARAAYWLRAARVNRVAAERWLEYHYDWRAWLPSNWRAVAECETHLNWRHSNSSFVSAFGISRTIYDTDARAAGVPGWSDVRPPTPRQQYLAALAHYRMFGDGWGCSGP
jgi:hypothetical protein